ncbi:MAG: hypothetical protein ABIG96_05125 [Candidatus Micrarchaeota archaeon]
MVCYAVPTATALAIFVGRKLFHKEHDGKSFRLGQLMLGGTVFGVVDHWWNGELFLLGPNIVADLMLGFAITGAIFGVWLATEAISLAPRPAATKQ